MLTPHSAPRTGAPCVCAPAACGGCPQAKPASLHSAARGAVPSARYKGLLVSGAQAQGLTCEYQRFLQGLPTFTAPSLSLQLGRLLVIGAALPLVLPVLPSMLLQRRAAALADKQQQQQAGAGGGGSSTPAAPPTPAASPAPPAGVHVSDDGEVQYPAGTPASGAPAVAAVYFALVQRVLWGVHDYLLAPLLGSGTAATPGAAGLGKDKAQ